MLFGKPRLPMEPPAAPPAPGVPAATVAPAVPGLPPVPPAHALGPAGLVNLDIGPDPGIVNLDMGPYFMEMPPVPPVPAPAPVPRVHVVVKGDTIYKLSRQYNISMQAIIQANNLRYPDVIYPGQRLIIPDGLRYDGMF